MSLNESHPDYKEFKEKWDRLVQHYTALDEAERKKYPDWKGFDFPGTDYIKPLNKKLKELQAEYSYLYD